jgi:hypothetical protein
MADSNPSHPNIRAALLTLPLFDGLFLRMQAANVSIVDSLIEPMEADLLSELIETSRTPIDSAMAVSAMSQMWMFALYELLRTWRQQVTGLLKIADSVAKVDADKRLATLEAHAGKIKGSRDDGNLAVDIQRENVLRLDDASFVNKLRSSFAVLDPIFRGIEALRITLAKHEIPKGRGLVASAPGYGRIDSFTGSIYWQIELKDDFVDVINRRSIADDLRALSI